MVPLRGWNRTVDEPVVSALIAEGSSRSSTFRRLVEQVSAADGIVYVEFGHCAFGHLNGCLLPFIVPTSGGRFLRIVVTPDATRINHEGLIALLAYELQHALEVLADPEVVDLDSMLAMYPRIDRPLSGRSAYETSDAHAVQDALATELKTTRARATSVSIEQVGGELRVPCDPQRVHLDRASGESRARGNVPTVEHRGRTAKKFRPRAGQGT